jgi:hypothetical protein
MNVELASYVGLIGSGLAIATFFGLSLIGILFVRLLDSIERYCTARREAREPGQKPRLSHSTAGVVESNGDNNNR